MIMDYPGGFNLLTGAFPSVVSRGRQIRKTESMNRTIAGRRWNMSHESGF